MNIEFDDLKHIYKVDGIQKECVSDILSGLGYKFQSQFVNPVLLENSQLWGKNFHLVTHLWDLGQLDETSVDPALIPSFEEWIRFKKDYDAEIISSEEKLYSKRYDFCGTPDKVARIKNQLCILDIKTGDTIDKKKCALQTAAYKILVDENSRENVKNRWVIHIPQGGHYKVEPFDYSGDVPGFINGLGWYRYNSRGN